MDHILCSGIKRNIFKIVSIRVQPSGGRLGMSCRPRHPRFESPLGFWSSPYVINGSGLWGLVSMVYLGLVLLNLHSMYSFSVLLNQKLLDSKTSFPIPQNFQFGVDSTSSSIH